MTAPHVITAVPTAFRADGTLDLQGSRAIYEYVARSGNEGAFVLGTTGEFPALSVTERGQLVELAMAELAESMRVIVHVGAPSLFEVLQLVDQARAAGAREIAVITPYYLPATDGALRSFFGAVSSASDGLDVYVYVYRRRSGNFVSTELMAELSRLPNVVGAKVSEEPLDQLSAYRAVVPERFVLYTGADSEVLRVADSGAQGVISGVSSVLPKPFRAAVRALEAGDAAAAAEAQVAVDEVVGAIGGDMGRMKAAYGMLGIAGGTTRMAIEPPDEKALELVRHAVSTHG